MKYIVTLRDKTYEVEVEHGEAMLLDEYEAKAPVPPAAAALTVNVFPSSISFAEISEIFSSFAVTLKAKYFFTIVPLLSFTFTQTS